LIAVGGCGDGSCEDIWCADTTTYASWQSDNYVFELPAGSAEAVAFEAAVEISGWGAFEGVTLGISHRDWGSNPVVSSEAIVRRDPVTDKLVAPVQILVYAQAGAGSYPTGRYTITATSRVGAFDPVSTTFELR
jgi:hypothetical protein